MNPLENLIQSAPEIEAKLGYRFEDKSLLALAFVHCSFVNENRDIVDAHNERLEFWGDSVLGLLTAEYLYRYLPSTPEGELSHLRARLVEGASCMRYMVKLDLESYLLLGRGEQRNHEGRGRESILSDLFEAIVGAIYLDSGLNEAKKFFFKNFSQEIEEIVREPLRNWKAELQDYSQKIFKVPPVYHVVNEMGPDHSKEFHVVVVINDEEMGHGHGHSKKEAQQGAAEDALSRLEHHRG